MPPHRDTRPNRPEQGDRSDTLSGAALLPRRFGAVVVDWLLSVLVASLLQGVMPLVWGGPLVFFLQYTLFTGLFGQTPGMRLFGIAVVDQRDGHPAGIARAAVRSLLLCLFVPAVVYGEDRRGLHDKAARTVVVRAA